VNFF
jgi:general transcription factor 3C polypeptide 2